MDLLSKVRTNSICLNRGTSFFGSRNASGSSPTGLPSGPRYCRYSISNLAARVMESGGLGQGAHSSWSGVGRIGAVRHDFLIGICLRGVFWVADGGMRGGTDGAGG